MGRYQKRIKNNTKQLLITAIIIVFLIIVGYFEPEIKSYIDSTENKTDNQIENVISYNLGDIPEYQGEPYVIVNDNIPNFSESDYTTEAFEQYSNLDELGRCGVAYANICKATMPKEGEKRGDISSVEPTGFEYQKKYDGEYLYNRCHLIGYQLSNENDNELNLITGTRYFNVNGMLPFENQVDDYIEENENNHVLYRVTPIFKENNKVASGVEMEAFSVEDNGKGVCFNVYIYNVQPGVEINYATGENWQ